jgi:hypothetical protein
MEKRTGWYICSSNQEEENNSATSVGAMNTGRRNVIDVSSAESGDTSKHTVRTIEDGTSMEKCDP